MAAKIARFNNVNSEITGRKLTKFGKKVQIHHLHIKSFHMVKKLRKQVQYIRKYLTKYASFFTVLYLTFTNDLVAMATSLEKSENKVTIHHLHGKRFHMVKRLQKSVQYIQRYSTKYAEPHEHGTQFPFVSLFFAETIGPIFTKFYTL